MAAADGRATLRALLSRMEFGRTTVPAAPVPVPGPLPGVSPRAYGLPPAMYDPTAGASGAHAGVAAAALYDPAVAPPNGGSASSLPPLSPYELELLGLGPRPTPTPPVVPWSSLAVSVNALRPPTLPPAQPTWAAQPSAGAAPAPPPSHIPGPPQPLSPLGLASSDAVRPPASAPHPAGPPPASGRGALQPVPPPAPTPPPLTPAPPPCSPAPGSPDTVPDADPPPYEVAVGLTPGQPAAEEEVPRDPQAAFICRIAREVVDPCLRPDSRLAGLETRWTNVSFGLASRIFVKVLRRLEDPLFWQHEAGMRHVYAEVGFKPSREAPPTTQEARGLILAFGGKPEHLNRGLSDAPESVPAEPPPAYSAPTPPTPPNPPLPILQPSPQPHPQPHPQPSAQTSPQPSPQSSPQPHPSAPSSPAAPPAPQLSLQERIRNVLLRGPQPASSETAGAAEESVAVASPAAVVSPPPRPEPVPSPLPTVITTAWLRKIRNESQMRHFCRTRGLLAGSKDRTDPYEAACTFLNAQLASREPLAMELEELVRPITRHIADNGALARPALGAVVAEAEGSLPGEAAVSPMLVVCRMTPRSALREAGVTDGDILVAWNGLRLHSVPDLRSCLAAWRPPGSVDLKLLRGAQLLKKLVIPALEPLPPDPTPAGDRPAHCA